MSFRRRFRAFFTPATSCSAAAAAAASAGAADAAAAATRSAGDFNSSAVRFLFGAGGNGRPHGHGYERAHVPGRGRPRTPQRVRFGPDQTTTLAALDAALELPNADPRAAVHPHPGQRARGKRKRKRRVIARAKWQRKYRARAAPATQPPAHAQRRPPQPPAVQPQPQPRRSSPVTLKLMFLNAGGGRFRSDGPKRICEFARHINATAVALTETHSHGAADNLSDPTGTYDTIRGREVDTTQKGMAMYTAARDTRWHYSPLTEYDSTCMQWTLISSTAPDASGAHIRVWVGSVYLPCANAKTPPARDDVWHDLQRAVQRIRTHIAADKTHDTHAIVIGGDLNGRTGCGVDEMANEAGAEIREFCITHEFELMHDTFHDTQAMDLPTYHGVGKRKGKDVELATVIDYVLISNGETEYAHAFDVHPHTGPRAHGIRSDHNPVSVTLTFTPAQPPCHADADDDAAASTAPSPAPAPTLKAHAINRALIANNTALRDALNELGVSVANQTRSLVHGAPLTTEQGHERGAQLVQQLADGIMSAAQTHCPAGAATRAAPHTPSTLERIKRSIGSAAVQLQRLTTNRAAPARIAAAKAHLKRLQHRRKRAARKRVERSNESLNRLLLGPETRFNPSHALDRIRRHIAPTDKARARAASHSVSAITDDATGQTVTDPHAIAACADAAVRRHRQSRHCPRRCRCRHRQRHCARHSPYQTSASDDAQELAHPVTVNEVVDAINRTAGRRAPGPDGVIIELLKVQADEMNSALALLFTALLRHGTWPAAWCVGNIVPIAKSGGGRLSAANYRGISLLSVDR